MNAFLRAAQLLRDPRREWRAIRDEAIGVQALYTRYVMALAAVPAVASFVGSALVGIGTPAGRYRAPVGDAVAALVVGYLLDLAAVYALALVANFLAPHFGGERRLRDAFKLAAHAPTGYWLAGVFSAVPALSVLGLAGLASLWLLFTGVPVLLRVPPEKALACFTLLAMAAIALAGLLAVLGSLALPPGVRGY